MTRGEHALELSRAEIADGAAAQRAARAVIARWVADTVRHRQRDMVKASLHAGQAHDIGGPLRTRRVVGVPLPTLAPVPRSRPARPCPCLVDLGPLETTGGGW